MSVLPIFLHPRKCVCLAFSLPFYLCNVYNNLFCARYLYIRQLRKTCFFKILIQGKLFQRCTHFLYCSVLPLGKKVNTRWMSQPDMESLFHKNNKWNILVMMWIIMWIFKIIKIKCFSPPRILNEHWCIDSCLQIPPRTNYFPCISTLHASIE